MVTSGPERITQNYLKERINMTFLAWFCLITIALGAILNLASSIQTSDATGFWKFIWAIPKVVFFVLYLFM